MLPGLRKPARLSIARLPVLAVTAMSFILCTGAIAAPSRRGLSRSAHARRDWTGHSARQRAIARHKRDDARWFRLTHSRRRARPVTDAASGGAFQRGDVFVTGSGSVQEYSPSGDLRQTLAGSAGYLCFDPSGDHLITPGAGMFDSSGNRVPSNWASVTNAGRCVADGFGNVYVAGPPTDPTWTITKYDIEGNPVHTFNVASLHGIDPVSIDVAPDDCTLYYHSYPADQIGRFDVCTNTQRPSLPGGSFGDDLRVLPNWQLLVTHDYTGVLLDASAQNGIQHYQSIPLGIVSFRSMSLDPDGKSFWMSGGGVVRYDINSGNLLSLWCGPAVGYYACKGPNAGGPIAVYSPPLFGDANVESAVDSNTAGTAEAFSTTAGYSGQMTRLHLWVDSSSTASKVVVGVYADHNGHPGRLQTQATDTNLTPGSWNYVDVPPTPVTKGQRHWIAVLAPTGGGTLYIRDTTGGGASQTSGRHKLTTLPAHWAEGNDSASAPVSAYAS
jgi:hypothetical protein